MSKGENNSEGGGIRNRCVVTGEEKEGQEKGFLCERKEGAVRRIKNKRDGCEGEGVGL